MKPAPFVYHCPDTLDEALALLAEHGSDAKALAGGQSLIPAMNFRLATPAVLVDLNAIRELSYISGGTPASTEVTAGKNVPLCADQQSAPIRIGAMTRQRELERNDVIACQARLITDTMPFVAHVAIRTRGTIGGSLAHADPAAELPAVMLALDAHFTVTSRTGSRVVRATDFFTGLFTTALAPGELLSEVTIPAAHGDTAHAFLEFSRRHGDFALAGVAAVVSVDESRRCTTARIALLGVGETPVLAEHAARVLIGQTPSADAVRAAAEAAATHDIDPPGDIHASSRYRRHLANVLTRRALEQACRAHVRDP